jgi:hypothetical protein
LLVRANVVVSKLLLLLPEEVAFQQQQQQQQQPRTVPIIVALADNECVRKGPCCYYRRRRRRRRLSHTHTCGGLIAAAQLSFLPFASLLRHEVWNDLCHVSQTPPWDCIALRKVPYLWDSTRDFFGHPEVEKYETPGSSSTEKK